MTIHTSFPRSVLENDPCPRTYPSLSQAHAKSNAAAVSHTSAMTPMSLRHQTGPNTPRSHGLSRQPHTSPASQGQANDTLPDGCQGNLSLRLALLRRSSTRFSRETEHESRGGVESRHARVRRAESPVAPEYIALDRGPANTGSPVRRSQAGVAPGPRDFSYRLGCLPHWFGEGEA